MSALDLAFISEGAAIVGTGETSLYNSRLEICSS